MNRSRFVGWILPLLLLLGSGVLGAVRESRAGGDVTWAANFEAARQQARREHRFLLLHFRSPGCGWCAKMDAETFTDPGVLELSRQFVCVRLESDVDTAATQQYSVFDYPMTIVADAEGHRYGRFPGYLAPEELRPILRAILAPPGHR